MFLAAFVALGLAFNKLVMCRQPVDDWVNGFLVNQRDRHRRYRLLDALMWPKEEVSYLRWNRAVWSVGLGVLAAVAVGTLIAVARRALGLE